MITTFCAYILIAVFFAWMERRRKSPEAKERKTGQFDRGTQAVLKTAFLAAAVVLILAPVLEHAGKLVYHPILGIAGLVIMMGGMALRWWASEVLGAFYTRTLLITSEHRVVDQGPYRLVRHPGYLGILALFVGAGSATGSWIAAGVITLLISAAYVYRIRMEETMLTTALGEPYRAYMAHTKRLIPFIY
jgi:protein-S-isoprenylcysteine O-methyltransferase Ste14